MNPTCYIWLSINLRLSYCNALIKIC
ncbi:hypothetical protein XACS582_14400001 [Xanthomonas citri pv. citri]|uniref:Uncharacterized protein n=1 Tax=Xanthomonas citri pv. citri TaxID=611301 RepID=A0A0U5BQJ2_XANCI|nr:hypothetical protein XAC908_1480067 [Xanthomonas citri pv. citri]CEE28937.1 hypothetical protein XAC2911_1490067 [Xanthomonas citri pv. citri]CEE29193.1 hypothetical protein XAC902_1880007 [Xanthomonas citri pv. citri]CEE36183.1 hypothetical protein XAC3810_340002 [Xanthomonas citri pv. citri]CEE56026.1 hypothetical protein XACS584_1460001 [Xanthomonas citri pv. citri]